MILIYGGAYQGKLEYAKNNYNIKSISECASGSSPDFSCDAIHGIDEFVLQCVRSNQDAVEYFREHASELSNKIIIANDISSGIVPMDKDVRAAREMNGRLLIYFASQADEVIRIFCGIGKKIK